MFLLRCVCLPLHQQLSSFRNVLISGPDNVQVLNSQSSLEPAIFEAEQVSGSS